MTQLTTLLTVAAVAAGLAACSSPVSAPEPQNVVVAETMPQTPDISDTTAGDAAAPAQPGEADGAAPTATEASPPQEKTNGYAG
jgi:hypothetical protein